MGSVITSDLSPCRRSKHPRVGCDDAGMEDPRAIRLGEAQQVGEEGLAGQRAEDLPLRHQRH